MSRLSSSFVDLPSCSDVVIIGSGYGGSVAAARLAEAGRSVCVLERGREFLPGDFSRSATADVRVTTESFDVGREDALCHYSVGPTLSVGCGVGLGGGSLINSGVIMRPDPRLWESARWPDALRQDPHLEADFARAYETLAPELIPTSHALRSRRSGVLRAAQSLDLPSTQPPLTISFEGGENKHGVAMNACNGCGECNAGCNNGAKGDLCTNYLALAHRRGARLFTQIEVTRIERRRGRWLTWLRISRSGRASFGEEELWIASERVILAAGSLGSASILLRSAEKGLPLSSKVGHQFSANGAAFGFSWGADEVLTRRSEGDAPTEDGPGPSITHAIDGRGTPELRDGVLIQDGLHPQWANPAVKWGLAAAAWRRPGDAAKRVMRPGQTLDRSMNWLFVGHDHASGRLHLEEDKVRISWAKDEEVGERVQERLRELSRSLDTVAIPAGESVTVHPLGGLPMGESAETGAVNHRGEVFAGTSGDATHDGLYVIDSSTLPISLGCNPIWTITALAERACRLLVDREGWRLSEEDAPPPSTTAPSRPDQLHFTERMRGYLSLESGTRAPLEFCLTVLAADVERMVADPDHRAELFGTVRAPELSPAPLRITDGRFALFSEDLEAVDSAQMIYSMELNREDGARWHFRGVKQLHGWRLSQAWPQTTTLDFELLDSAGDRVGPGQLRLSLHDLLRQAASWRVDGEGGLWGQARSTGRFVGMFLGGLRRAYGGVLAPTRRGVSPSARRELRLPAPEPIPARARDRAELRLTRYQGGSRGPVLLLHGYAATSSLFANDTVETCLAEALVAEGYDVWLGEWRGSGRLEASRRPFTLDHVAERDIPSLVQRVLARSGAAKLDILAHCIGSRVTLMAMTAGYLPAAQVRSFLGLQVGLHWQNTPSSWLRAHSRLPDLFSKLGVHSLRSDAGIHDGLHYRALDLALTLLPTRREDRCSSPSCRRSSALWGQLFHHPNLRRDTHDTICEMLGTVNTAGIAHLAAQMREGFAVDGQGRDIYIPHLDQILCPTLFLYGEENQAVAAGTSRRTSEALARAHIHRYHRWESIPGYGHLDTLVGRDAAKDVYPRILEFLGRWDRDETPQTASSGA